ncbi:unnamed protein product, partial [marine sediment metagenome]
MKLRGFAVCLALSFGALALMSCTRQSKEEITVLMRMMPAQDRYFRTNVLAVFEKQHNCRINVAWFNNQWDIERLLKLDAKKRNPEIALVKTPFEMTRVLANKGLMKTLHEVVDSTQVTQDMAEYHQLASGLGFVYGKPYYFPRKLETRILFY